MKCPVCGKVLAKKYRRGLTELEWYKLQYACWMEAWNREVNKKRKTKWLPFGPLNKGKR